MIYAICTWYWFLKYWNISVLFSMYKLLKLQFTWWHCPEAALDKGRSGSCSTDQGSRHTRAYAASTNGSRDVQHWQALAMSRWYQWFRHWGSKPSRKHWRSSASQSWQGNSMFSPSSARIRCQGSHDNSMGSWWKKLMPFPISNHDSEMRII